MNLFVTVLGSVKFALSANPVASHAVGQAEDAAHALIVGLMLSYMPEWDKYQASAAAIDHSRQFFSRKAMFYRQSSQPKRVYMFFEVVDAETFQPAPERILSTHAAMTLYSVAGGCRPED